MIKRANELIDKEWKFPNQDGIAIQHHTVKWQQLKGKINSYCWAELHKGFQIPVHPHNDNKEIFIVVKGRAKYIDSDGKEYELGAGDVGYCFKGESHSIGNDYDEPVIVCELNIPMEE
jgi:quercetin dioxygenase-like cupin family protein